MRNYYNGFVFRLSAIGLYSSAYLLLWPDNGL